MAEEVVHYRGRDVERNIAAQHVTLELHPPPFSASVNAVACDLMASRSFVNYVQKLPTAGKATYIVGIFNR